MPDESLCLRTPDADCKDVYTVIPNDTCEKVASDYGVDPAEFWYNNPLLNEDCTNLYIDEVCIFIKRPMYDPNIHTAIGYLRVQ
jgi:hypothetical protein